MPISATKTRILLTLDRNLLAWVDAQAKNDNRDRNNYLANLIKCEYRKCQGGLPENEPRSADPRPGQD